MRDRLSKRMLYLDLDSPGVMKKAVSVNQVVDAVADLPDDEILGVATLILHRVREPRSLINWVAQSLTGG